MQGPVPGMGESSVTNTGSSWNRPPSNAQDVVREQTRSSGIEFQVHTRAKGKSTAREGDRGGWGVLQRATALWGHGHAEQRLEGGDLWIPGDGVQVERRVWTITSCLGSRGAPGVILLRGLWLDLKDASWPGYGAESSAHRSRPML